MDKLKTKLQYAEDFARKKHSGQLKKDGVTLITSHLEDVVLRLKSLSILDEDVLCAGWLHDILEGTNTSVEEIEELFGKKITTLVLTLTKDNMLPKNRRDSQYIIKLKSASLEAKLVKICDIFSNLKDVHRSDFPNSKTVKKIMRYFNPIQNEIIESVPVYPSLSNMIDDINDIIVKYGLRPISQHRS